MIQGFKKGDLVVHPNVPQVLRVSSISGPFAFLLSAAEGFHVGEFPLAHLQLASEFCPEARDFRAGDIVIHEGEEAHVDRAKNGKLWVNDRRKVHIVDKYRVRRAPIDVGNWVRVCATGLVGMVTSRDPSYVHAFKVSGSDDAYHERELARTTEPAPVGPMTVPPDDIQVNDILLYRSLPDNEFAIVEVRVSSIIDDTYLLEGENGRIYG